MEPLSDPPKRKRGRPAKYASAEERKASKIAHQRDQRQSIRATDRARNFDDYYSIPHGQASNTYEPPSTYFPSGELSIATEIEQLLPPTSLGLNPWELSALDPAFVEERLLEESILGQSNGTIMQSPECTQSESHRACPSPATNNNTIPETNVSSTSASEVFVESASTQREVVITQSTDQIGKLARVLTDQLQLHHGCCRQCHEQRAGEHDAEHLEHPGLAEYMDRVQAEGGFPDVLSIPTIARREDDLVGQTTAERKREIYTGIPSASSTSDGRPVHVCLAADHKTQSPTGVSLDIDSVVGFANSLAVAKLGVRWNPTQMAVTDLRSGLHLDPLLVHYSGSDGRMHHVRRPVHKIPHYTFGRLVGFEDLSLYFLFPRLFRGEQQSSRLRDEDFRIWMDQVLLPAIYQHYEGSLVQHYPSSFDHSRLNATARGLESRSQRVDPVARQQQLFYFLPPEALSLVWTTIQATIERAGLQQFRDLTILVQGKNLKTLTKANTWNGMTQLFTRHWDNAIDGSYLSDDAYVDIGKETCPDGFSRVGGDEPLAPRHRTEPSPRLISPSPQTLLWRRCCLDSYAEWIGQQHPSESSHPQQQFYPISLLHDSGSLTLETRRTSPLRKAGLLYTQLYSSVKEVFAAGDVYPFTNPSIETLALDPQLRKTWTHVGSGLSHDPVALTRAYLNMKQRCYAALQGSYLKVFGLREEHRVSFHLFHAIDQQFRERNLQQSRLPEAPSDLQPFYSLPTSTLLFWFHWNINKFCVGFETVYSINDRHFVTWEHTRVMMMFLRCLQFSYAGGLLQRVSGCWRDVWYQPDARRPDGLRRCEGLGFQRNMRDYGYAWFLDKINWDTMTFCQPSAPHMMFNSPSMQAAFHARYSRIRDVRLDFLRVHQAHRWMEEFSSTPPCLELVEDFLRQFALCVFRKDVFLQIKRLLHPDYVDRALAGEVPLSHDSIAGVVIDGARPLQLMDQRRIAVKHVDTIFAWLWEWKDGRYDRKGWKDKPYRMVFQQSFEAINHILGKDRAREWKMVLKTSFIQSHWFLPYPHGSGFMRKAKDTGQELWWSNFNHDLFEHYRQWYGSRITQKRFFPAEYIKHHPTNHWGPALGEDRYMQGAMEPEMDLVRIPEGEFYAKLLETADRFSQNPNDVRWKKKAPPAVFRFQRLIGDEAKMKVHRKMKDSLASGLCIDLIHALDQYEVLGHSGRILRPRKRRSTPNLATTDENEDAFTSDEESIDNRRDGLLERILELEPKMREAVVAEREKLRWPLLHGAHLDQIEPRLRQVKTGAS